jgi:hypothetical protein
MRFAQHAARCVDQVGEPHIQRSIPPRRDEAITPLFEWGAGACVRYASCSLFNATNRRALNRWEIKQRSPSRVGFVAMNRIGWSSCVSFGALLEVGF